MAKIPIKTYKEIEYIRASCRIVAEVLKILEKYIQPGVLTKELDEIAEEYIYSCGAEPAFKGYGSDEKNLFPASVCTSVDDEVVHGIPGNRQLQNGEIISIDVGVKKNQYYGDGACTYRVGNVSEEKERLMRVTQESLFKGIEQAQSGNRLHNISAAIQLHVESAGFSVVRKLVGHGIGRELHEEPAVPNFGKARTGPLLQSGVTLAIEPMVSYGTYDVYNSADGWVWRTSDGTPSAHFEHTVLITDNGPEILTLIS